MNLHRTTGKPDWDGLDAQAMNRWQRLAARTHGIFTPANLITVLGFAIVIRGLLSIARGQYWQGLVLLIIGRLADIVDGWLAEATGTKSPLGELLDVVIDKLGLLLVVIILYTSKTAPWWVLVALLVPQITISLITVYHAHTKVPIHPSKVGKLSMFGAGVSLLGLILLRAIAAAPHDAAEVIVYAVALLSTGMALYAATGYALQKD